MLNIPPCFILEGACFFSCIIADPSGIYLIKSSKLDIQLLFPWVSNSHPWHTTLTFSNSTTNLQYTFGSNSRVWLLFHWLRTINFEGWSEKELKKSSKTSSRAAQITRVKGLGVTQWDLKRGNLLKEEKKTPKWSQRSWGRLVCELSLLAHSFSQGELQVWGFTPVGTFTWA